jgi:hypothetical protein
MKKVNVIATVLGATLLAATAGSALAASGFNRDNEFLSLAGEWEIGNGETHTIAHHKQDEMYRICVRKDRYSVPVKVMFDGKQETIAAGNCSDVEAMDIQITPAVKLAEDNVLIGKFEHLHR